MDPVAAPEGVRRLVVRDSARPAARLTAALVVLVAFDLVMAAVVWWQFLRGSP